MIKKILRVLKRLRQKSDFVNYEGISLPLNRSNENLSGHKAYLDSGVEQVNFLISKELFNTDTKLLDFGCGQGRLLNTLKFTKSEFRSYTGLDTSKKAIDWCNKHLKYSNEISFMHLPAANARYNPDQKELKNLPFKKNQFDLIFLNSVFSHMLTSDVIFYLSEFHKVLDNEGKVYITAFLEDNVPDVEENPEDYLDKKSIGSLHRVRFNKDFFFKLVNEASLSVVEYHHQHISRTQQSVIVLKKQ